MVNAIISDFIDFKTWLHNWLFYRRHAIKLRLAISLADMKQRAFNKRYFVVIMETPKGDKLVSINNEDFKRMKRKDWLPKGMSCLDLQNECFYQTAIGLNNKTSVQEREKAKEKYIKYAKKYLV